ncbi:MAG: phenylalanine--tRNA ligase subunit beta [Tenericutes bacterium]|nr:phenylalanine--tRNA ligase subunit beta [Mycoplasmatota bacterium]
MKLSRKFVSDYIDIDDNITIKELAEDMTGIGNEYDSCGKLIPATNLVIGEVIECVNHPDSDHLHVCKVNVGNEVLQIVCGAPNVRTGLKVIVALDGANLPGGVIKKGIIRGQESNGMLCAMSELGLEHKFLTDKDIKGIHELPSDAKVGDDPIKYLQLDDEVIDFELTSNRGDLLSILGMAYEIGALYNKKVKDIDLTFKENNEDINNSFMVDVKTDNCPLFLAKKVKNVTIKESPDFIKNRLIASGIRPINNVVDISNYVMLETGQPLHYYDSNRLGDTLVVRMADEGEKLTTLDNIERALSNNDIVIANNYEAVGLAGVMGGLTTEIEEDTKDIIIESAIFDKTLVRKTSKKILRSEASNRFEKGLDPKRTYMAMMRSCHLLEKYADAEIVGGMVEYNTLDMDDEVVPITVNKINQVLGTELEEDTILDIFTRLGFTYEKTNENILVTVPTRRCDISITEDLIEEVGRIYGIDNIQGRVMTLPVKPGNVNKNNRIIRNKLASLGLNETLSYALIPYSEVKKYTLDEFEIVKLLDPMSEDRNSLRYSLIPSLMSIYEYNKARGNKDICIYEIGKGFSKINGEYHEESKLAILMTGLYNLGMKPKKVNFYTIKGIMEELLDYLGYSNRYSLKVEDIPNELHPGQSASIILNNVKIGIIGKVHPSVTKDDIYVLEINLDKMFTFRVKQMQYKEISKFPGVKKDLAFVVDKKITAQEVMAAIKKAGGRLVTDIKVFDVYEGENVETGKKSLAFSLTFEDATKTLNDEEVMTVFNRIIEEVENKLKVKVRDK